MNVIGTDFVKQQLDKPGYFFKMILNDSGAAFFSASIQHRTVKVPGLSYEDGPNGNALAAIITNGCIEIRKHPSLSEGRVKAIIQSLLNCSDLSALRGFNVTYQGKKLI